MSENLYQTVWQSVLLRCGIRVAEQYIIPDKPICMLKSNSDSKGIDHEKRA
jgi:hypothetical protein